MQFQHFLPAALLITLVSCTKSDLFTTPFDKHDDHEQADSGLSDSFFGIAATMDNMGSSSRVTVNETNGAISMPAGKTIQLSVKENFRAVRDIKWIANGSIIANGNNAEAVLPAIGIGRLNVEFTEVQSGRKHNKELKLYAYRQMYLSVVVNPAQDICGDVAIGITQTLVNRNNEKIGPFYLENSIQRVCIAGTEKTARTARIPVSVYDQNTTFSIDLIEPNKITTSNKAGFCLLFICFGGSFSATSVNPRQVYQTDHFPATLTNHLTPGQYTSGSTVLTIE